VNGWSALADAVLVVHASFVAFVVVGQTLVLAGLGLGWAWVRNRAFRLAHLAAIGVVVAQAWVGVLCPLTILENALRERAGESGYAGSFIQHWLHRLIFYDAEGWVFTTVYTVFGLLVALTWRYGAPQPRR
jgi:polyferredoxin